MNRIALVLAYVAGGAAILFFAWSGREYYLLALGDRARHASYWQLKPGGDLGLLFGYLGAGMMTLLLVYSLRKRVSFLRRLGPLRQWLHWHIFLGIYGPLFIVLHSSLKVGGLVSISFWSMATVALSGVFGRFLYSQIPRTQAGEELSLQQIVKEEERLAQHLRSHWNFDTEGIDAIRRVSELGTTAALPSLLIALPFQGVVLRTRLSRELQRFSALAPHVRRKAFATALNKARVHQRLVLLDRVKKLFHYWHVFHKPFALIMYALMMVHIAVAWRTGYGGLSL